MLGVALTSATEVEFSSVGALAALVATAARRRSASRHEMALWDEPPRVRA